MRKYKFLTLLTLGSTVALVGVARGKKDNADQPARGRLTRIEKDSAGTNAFNLVITSGGKNNQREVTLTADDSTQVVIDGKSAKLADLVEGEPVTVTPAEGKAQTIAALTRPAGKRANADVAEASVAKPSASPTTAPATRPAKG